MDIIDEDAQVVRRGEGGDLSWIWVVTLPILFETMRDNCWVKGCTMPQKMSMVVVQRVDGDKVCGQPRLNGPLAGRQQMWTKRGFIVTRYVLREDWASSWRRIHAGPGAAKAEGRKRLESVTREIKDAVNMIT